MTSCVFQTFEMKVAELVSWNKVVISCVTLVACGVVMSVVEAICGGPILYSFY